MFNINPDNIKYTSDGIQYKVHIITWDSVEYDRYADIDEIFENLNNKTIDVDEFGNVTFNYSLTK